MKGGRPRRPRAAVSVDFSAKFKALSFSERDRGTFRVRRLLRWLTRPTNFVFVGFCTLVAPSLWFVSKTRRTTAAPPPSTAELEGRWRTHLRAPPREGVTSPAAMMSRAGDHENINGFPSAPAMAERAHEESTTARRAMTTPLNPVPPALASGGEESSVHGGQRARQEHEKPSSWRPPVLPVEVFRDVPPEECLRNPLWEKEVDPSDYEFGCEEIHAMLAGEKELIGHGNIRDVYMVEDKGRRLVLKALREDYELRASKARADKIHRWEAAALDEIKGHPNMVDMLGVCGASSVSEFYDVRLDDLVLSPGAKPLPISMVVSMALDAARGLQALHEAPGGAIVHFDIKPQQMMLDGKGTIKINDLNMCRFVDADANGNSCEFKSSACRVGPWRAPENIAGKDLTEKVDIYGLAMVYYSMLALHPPYADVPDGTGDIKNGIPPTVDPSWHPGFLEIVRDMWNHDPKARPSARRVAQRLEILQQYLTAQTV